MGLTRTKMLLPFIMIITATTTYSQGLRGISDSADSHFIGDECSLPANQRVCIQVFSEDSLFNLVAFDSSLTKPMKLLLIADSLDAISMQRQYPHDIIVPLSIKKPGFYVIRYISRDTVFSSRFIFMK